MAVSQTNIDKHQDNLLLAQRKANENRHGPHPSSSIQQFQQITQKIMSRSRMAGTQHIAPNPYNSKTSKDKGNSVTPIVACPSDEGNRRISHRTASSANCLANNRFSNQNLSHSKAQDHRMLRMAQSLHPKSLKDRRTSSDHKLLSNHDPSKQLMPSSIKESCSSSSHQKANNLAAVSNADAVPLLNRVVQAKLASRNLTRTSSRMSKIESSGSVTVSNPKVRIETKDLAASNTRQDELCKDCKKNIMESVCFINNEGKITAALTHRLHYCKRPGCAANRNYQPSALSSSKKALVSKRQARPLTTHPQHTENKSRNFVELGDHSSSLAGASSSIQVGDYDRKNEDLIHIKETSSDNGLSNGHQSTGFSACKEQEVLDGFPHTSENLRCLVSSWNGGERQSNRENNIHTESSTGSCISSDILHGHDDDHSNYHEIGSVEQGAIDELHDFKSFCYHGDNEYSCSEDGTDATPSTTPNSLIKGAFDSLSCLDVEEHAESKVSNTRRSSMARMRRKYLESLKEQEAETVRLRKQEIMARKQAGDWMLDCHMEELLHRLAPNGEARVKVLVEAFETVIQHSDSESSQTHHQDHHNQMHDGQEEQLNSNMHSDASC